MNRRGFLAGMASALAATTIPVDLALPPAEATEGVITLADIFDMQAALNAAELAVRPPLFISTALYEAVLGPAEMAALFDFTRHATEAWGLDLAPGGVNIIETEAAKLGFDGIAVVEDIPT